MRGKPSERQSRRRPILFSFLQHLHRNLHTFTFLENISNDIEYLYNEPEDLKSSGVKAPCGFESRPRHLKEFVAALCHFAALPFPFI